jgi:hypothetical protein
MNCQAYALYLLAYAVVRKDVLKRRSEASRNVRTITSRTSGEGWLRAEFSNSGAKTLSAGMPVILAYREKIW